MNEDWVIEYINEFTAEHGRGPTDEEITNAYANACDWAYETYIDGLIHEHKEENK